MIVVIQYKTPYLINNTSPLILSFDLGNDIALHSVLDILYLLAMDAVVDLVEGQLFFFQLIQEIILHLDSPGKGLLGGTNNDTFFLLCLTASLLIFHPYPCLFSILSLMAPLSLDIRIFILVIL